MGVRWVSRRRPHAGAVDARRMGRVLRMRHGVGKALSVQDVHCIRRGRMRLFPVAELERWAGDNAERSVTHRDA